MKVVLYSAPGCGFCILIENFLKKNGVSYAKVDISSDPKAKKEMIEKSGQESVPVTDINGKIIVGYRLKEIKEAPGK